MAAAVTRDERNAADGPFSAACHFFIIGERSQETQEPSCTITFG